MSVKPRDMPLPAQAPRLRHVSTKARVAGIMLLRLENGVRGARIDFATRISVLLSNCLSEFNALNTYYDYEHIFQAIIINKQKVE